MIDFDTLTTGDLELDAEGNIALVDGFDEIRQRVQTRLSLQRGEWAYDTSLGLDFFGEIAIANPDFSLIRSRITTLVQTTPGVTQVVNVGLFDNKQTRCLEFEILFTVDPRFGNDAERLALGLDPVTLPVNGSLDFDQGELNFILPALGGFV